MRSNEGSRKMEMGFWRATPPEKPKGIKYTFRDVLNLLCPSGSHDLDFLIVTGHNTAVGGREQGVPEKAKHLRGGNFSDLRCLPRLVWHYANELGGQVTTAGRPRIEILPSVYLELSEAKKHNLVALGAGNVNWLTEHIFYEYWGDAEKLPLHFKTADSHEIIVSELSGKEYAIADPIGGKQEDYGILEMVPNPWNYDKVVILCCGVDFWGTQASVGALCQKVQNNKHNNEYPAKVLKVRLKTKTIETFKGDQLTIREIESSTFAE